jgi:hypothetical protein
MEQVTGIFMQLWEDYVQFSNRGASIASQLFFDAFAAEYAKWQKGASYTQP